VPGTDVMTKKKDLIKYNILELRNGSSLVLITNDKELVDAISQFIKYQATAHVGH
jgi:TusA-related sulfurtransferase